MRVKIQLRPIIHLFRLKDSNRKINFIYYLTIALLATGLAYYYTIQREIIEFTKDLQLQEANYIKHHTRLMEYQLKTISSDILSQSRHSALQYYANTGDYRYLKSFENEFFDFSAIHGTYDQVRFIDISGWEKVRINYDNAMPKIVDTRNLQNKKKRYYFQDVLNLKAGELYISPLDLNIEHEKIEIPYKPVIRLATPIFDDQGRKKGIFIVNFLGSHILQEFKKDDHNPLSVPFLINEEGYYLVSDKSENEWGFMFDDKKNLTFKNDFPEAWKIISVKSTGEVFTNEGYFAFSTIDLMEIVTGGSLLMKKPAELSSPRWKIISYHSQSNLNKDILDIFNSKIYGFFVIMILAGIAAWILALYRQKTFLAEQESKKLAIAVMQSPASVVITDTDGTIEYVNPAFSKISGYSSSEAIGKNPRILKSLIHPKDFYKNMWDVLLSGNEWRGEICNRRKDGSLYWESSFISPVKDPYGETLSYIAVKQDISDMKKNEEILRNLSLTDSLTGLANRRNFDQALKAEILRLRRNKRPLSLMMLDIDKFKEYNDLYGHQSGDECLKSVAAVLKNSLKRPGDMAARYGGEEFVIILPETEIHHSMTLAENIRMKIENLKIPHGKSSVYPFVTVSIGVAFTDDVNRLEAEQLIKFADTALYAAKRQGRNRVVG